MNCPSKIKLEAYFLEKRFAEALEPHLPSCTSCQTLLKDMESERSTFLKNYPFSRLLPEMEAKRKPLWKRALENFITPGAFVTALAMAGLAGLMVVNMRPTAPVEPEIQVKGGVGLSFYAADGASGKVQPGKDGAPLAPGTQIQFIYSDAGSPYLLLIGVEENGAATPYFSDDTSGAVMSAAITTGSKLKLPQGLRWEPKSDYERFFAIFSERPITLDEVRKALSSLASEGKTVEQTPKLPLPYPQASILLHRKNGK